MTADFERFDALLARVGAPIAATSPAGAVDELDAACASIGLTPPPGLRDWYRWRNGPGPLAPDSPALLIGRFAAVDVATALAVRDMELDATAANPVEEFRYQPGWFPISAGAGTSGIIAVDCDTQPGTIVMFDPHIEMPEIVDDRIAADVAELVDRYIWLLESDKVTGPEPHWPHRIQIALFADDPWVYNLLRAAPERAPRTTPTTYFGIEHMTGKTIGTTTAPAGHGR